MKTAPSIAVLVLALSACHSGSDAPKPPAAAKPSETKPLRNLGYADGSKPAASTAPDAKAPASSGLAFAAQPGWTVEKPTSAMRKAQYALPHAEGDAEDASLVVYFFGGGGGSLQANLDRWSGQFEQPDGKASADVMKSSTRTANGMTVHEVDLAGTYVAETSPGSGQRVRKENWRMRAAVIDAKEGPYYAKLVGPAATVAHWEASFTSFVDAAKPAP